MKIATYNLFPSILGNIKNWYAHVARAKEMGFSWVYINPITYPGFSGSLYATKDYYSYNNNYFSSSGQKEAEKEIKEFLEYCKTINIKVMIDLVINHSSKDCILTETNKNWYILKDDELVSPSAWDNGELVEWGDLASFNNEESEDIDNLWNYWNNLIKYNIDLGFSGFRCDAAYKVTNKLWYFLINNAKNYKKDVVFFAETLGCPIEDIILLSEAGFDYVASSAKWWNYSDEWFIDQYEEAIKHAKQVAFPENHDTERTIKEYNGNISKVKQRAFFTAIVCDMWMITIGFEYGFLKRCNVVGGDENDYENINYDLSDYIKRLIEYVKQNDILAGEGKLESINLIEKKEEDNKKEKSDNDIEDNKNDDIEICESCFKKLYKYSIDKNEKLMIIINTSDSTEIFTDCRDYKLKEDISLENALGDISDKSSIEFLAHEVKVFNIF